MDELEPCPGCERMIDPLDFECPHCKYDLEAGKPAPKPKEPKEPKAKRKARTKVSSEVTESNQHAVTIRLPRAHQTRIAIPALGRFGQPAINFAELHWPDKQEVTDESLLQWAENLREAWLRKVSEREWLMNHALGYLAERAEKPLSENAARLVTLMGGDDWQLKA